MVKHTQKKFVGYRLHFVDLALKGLKKKSIQLSFRVFSMGVFTFFKSYKWYQIAQSITNIYILFLISMEWSYLLKAKITSAVSNSFLRSIKLYTPIEHPITRSSHRKCSVKKVFLEILQNSQENICGRVSFLIKLQAYFYTPWKRQKTKCFLTFSGCIEISLQIY